MQELPEISLNNVAYIPTNHHPPASLEGSSVVYVLHIYNAKHPELPGTFYVGETESLQQRLRQHRDYYKKHDCQVVALAWNVNDKSMARQTESKLIPWMKQKGYVFERDTDASHTLFSRGMKK